MRQIRNILIILCLVFFTGGIPLYAQSASVQLLSETVCDGIVETPVLGSQLQGIASVSLRLLFDSAALQFAGIRGIHPSMGSSIHGIQGNKFVLAWFSLNAVNLSDTLFVLRWTNRVGNGTWPLSFDTATQGQCELANIQGQPLNVQFISGTATHLGATAPLPLTPLILQNVIDTSVAITWQSTPCIQQAVLQWSRFQNFDQQVFTSIMSNTTHQLSINGFQPLIGDSIIYWRLGGIYGADTSWSATGRLALATFVHNQISKLGARVYPNPFSNSLTLDVSENIVSESAYLKIYDVTGRRLCEATLPVQSGRIHWQIPCEIPSGWVLLQWQLGSQLGVKKIFKSPFEPFEL
jgi:hypothetical protein